MTATATEFNWYLAGAVENNTSQYGSGRVCGWDIYKLPIIGTKIIVRKFQVGSAYVSRHTGDFFAFDYIKEVSNGTKD